MRAAFCTLGCKVNTYDSSMMAQALKDAGYEIVDFESPADVYIINSCTVTGTGDKKSRQMVSRVRSANPEAIVCMAGCMAQTAHEEVEKLGVDLILGTSQKARIAELIEKARVKKVVAVEMCDEYEDCFKTLQEDRTRGFLKIQDGCDRFCTYCIIPFARGKSKSRKLESIAREAIELALLGYRELVLTGIHIASYGKDTSGSLIDAVMEVAKVEGIERIRLGSLEPLILTDDFCNQLAQIHKICPSFHVSMQSGCDKTLKAMGRKYNSSEFKKHVENLRKYFPDASITTDIIVGFPGETEEDFNDCLTFVKDMAFARCHVFPYSRRSGTAADRLPLQIEKQEKHRRAKIMIGACNDLEKSYIESQISTEDTVLFEADSNEMSTGYTSRYIRVYLEETVLTGTIKRVTLKEKYKDGVIAQII